MTNTVNLLFKAHVSSFTSDIIPAVERAITNSSSWVIEKKTSDNGLSVHVKTYTEKLEKLQYELETAGLELDEQVSAVVANAANQYSVFRDIEVTLVVNEVPYDGSVSSSAAAG